MQEVTAAAEKRRYAMIDPARENLAALVADDLLDGKSDFVTITIQTVKAIVTDLAIVRHTLAADTNDSGKPGKVTLKVLGVWQKQAGQWKLLARQAVRPV